MIVSNSFKQLSSAATRQVAQNNCPQCLRLFRSTHQPQALRRRTFFSSPSNFQAPAPAKDTPLNEAPIPQRKASRAPAGKTSLRRVAAEAQRSRDAALRKEDASVDRQGQNRVIAISAADQFDMDAVCQILRSHGFTIDPDNTGFDSDQVVHTRGVNNGDIFVFPSGSVVAWSLPEDVVLDLATKMLLPAAVNPHVRNIEKEDLEYNEDDTRDNSAVKGDVIVLGTKREAQNDGELNPRVDTTLAKIAFSSGLARSTKLAVLETMLTKYFESTRTIPTLLAQGRRLPLNRRGMLKKTGELLELRAQLNHYSELTDSLPDIFWDSRYELGLEGYYEQVGRALDVGVRIKALNEKMDYAQEIASILRQTMSEKHSIELEWIIILLIAVEVVFALRKEWRERMGKKKTSQE
ncbi:hypothetical protein F5884DRAFT_11073 [Xylogone sp. PMI_703]|nr:hypothetical protein F5884DRAFT_11073 [Xylogone sp. PMI_703]